MTLTSSIADTLPTLARLHEQAARQAASEGAELNAQMLLATIVAVTPGPPPGLKSKPKPNPSSPPIPAASSPLSTIPTQLNRRSRCASASCPPGSPRRLRHPRRVAHRRPPWPGL